MRAALARSCCSAGPVAPSWIPRSLAAPLPGLRCVLRAARGARGPRRRGAEVPGYRGGGRPGLLGTGHVAAAAPPSTRPGGPRAGAPQACAGAAVPGSQPRCCSAPVCVPSSVRRPARGAQPAPGWRWNGLMRAEIGIKVEAFPDMLQSAGRHTEGAGSPA